VKGHIQKRSKGSWTLWVDLGRDLETGKCKQQTLTVQGSKKDAERELRTVLTRIEGGAYVKPAKMTVGEYLKQWLESYVVTNVTPKTQERYEGIIRVHLMPAFGSLPLTALQPQHIQDYYSHALKSGRRDSSTRLSALTVRYHHIVLYEALKHAVKHGLLIRNVAEAVDPPTPERREIAIIDSDGVRMLLQAAEGMPYYTCIFTAIYTGLRRSELLGLRWYDIDLDLATLSVTQTLHQLKNGTYVFGKPKTKGSRRMITLSPSLAILLREHKAKQQFDRMLLGKPLSLTDLVFLNPDGSPLRPNTVSRAFERLARPLGFQGIRFHDLRHAHATLMLQQGIHPKIVSERLGHNSVAITLDLYSHVLPGLQEAAAIRFEECLKPGLPEAQATKVR
jgi:integrase